MNIVTPASSAEIAALWLSMTGIYGHRWTSAYGADPRTGAGEIWARALAGLAPRQIGSGVEACIAGSYSWPPTAPEFRSLCFGVPVFAAVALALQADERDPFATLVWRYANSDEQRFKLAPADKQERMLRDAYDLAREHVMRGGALPEVLPAIGFDNELPPYSNPDLDHKQDVLAKVRAELHVEQPKETIVDPHAEAETVLEQRAAVEQQP